MSNLQHLVALATPPGQKSMRFYALTSIHLHTFLRYVQRVKFDIINALCITPNTRLLKCVRQCTQCISFPDPTLSSSPASREGGVWERDLSKWRSTVKRVWLARLCCQYGLDDNACTSCDESCKLRPYNTRAKVERSLLSCGCFYYACLNRG